MKVLDFLFKKNCWYVKYRKSNNHLDILTILDEWMTINVPKRYWIADPFLFRKDGRSYIFCELMDRKKSHGKIGFGEISENGNTEIKELMDLGCHASYPNIFEYKNDIYMLPETSERHTLEIYKCIEFPYKWSKSILLRGVDFVDSTIWISGDYAYVFLYTEKSEGCELRIGEIDFKDLSVKNLSLVKEYSDKTGRPAGNVFEYHGNYIRPTQDCRKFYGEKIILKAFSIHREENTIEYFENDYDEIDVNQVLGSGTKYYGIHTYNFDGVFEIIDVQCDRWYIFRPLQALLKKTKLFGYRTDKNYK